MARSKRGSRQVVDDDEDDEVVLPSDEEEEVTPRSSRRRQSGGGRAAGKRRADPSDDDEEQEDEEQPRRGGKRGSQRRRASDDDDDDVDSDGGNDSDDAAAGGRSKKRGKSAAAKSGERSKRGRQGAADDDDDYEAATGSAAATPARRRNTGDGAVVLDREDLTRKGRDLARLALFYARRKSALRRDDMKKYIFKDGPYSSRALDNVFDKAQEILADVFGFEMVQLPKGEGRGGQLKLHEGRDANAASGGYVLVSKLKYDPAIRMEVTDREDANAVDGLLYTILIFVMMSNHAMSEDALYNNLERIGYARVATVANQTVEARVKQFVDERYLSKVKVTVGSDDAFEYRWGPRAKVEMDVDRCIDFVGQVLGIAEDRTAMALVRRQVLQAKEIQEAALRGDDDDAGEASSSQVPATQASQATPASLRASRSRR